jgi:hypothetical protein
LKLPASVFGFWLYIALSIALGMLMAKAVELPALALRERLFPASSQRPVAIQVEAESAVILGLGV